MKRNALEVAPVKRWFGLTARDGDPFGLDIEIDEEKCTVRVYDPRAFHSGRRAFCRRLLEVATRQPGMEKAEIDLAAASCRLEFDPRSATSQGMAQVFSDAVQQAAGDATASDRSLWRRPSRRWAVLTAYRTDAEASFWETLEISPGRIRLRHPGLSGDRARFSRLADSMAGLEGVEACNVSRWSHTLTVDFHPARSSPGQLLDAAESILEEWTSGSIEHVLSLGSRSAASNGVVPSARGIQRIGYLALAGGAFAMTIVGLVVPGVPTVPFLFATSYYLARSSPRLNDRLRRTAFFGPILDEWERHHALSWASKGKLLGLTATIIIVTVALAPLSPVALILIVILSSLSVWGVARLPALPQEGEERSRLEPPARLALPAP